MVDTNKALAAKLKKREELVNELKALDSDISALKVAKDIVSGKRGRRAKGAAPSASAGGPLAGMKTPKAILKLLGEKKIKESAPSITSMLLEGGWTSKSDKPETGVYITLAKMAAEKKVKKEKKGRRTVFYI